MRHRVPNDPVDLRYSKFLKVPLSNSCPLTTTTMLRVGLLRPIFNLQSAARCKPQAFSRAFSNTSKPNVLQSNFRSRPTILSLSLLSKFSRSISSESVVSRPSQAESWKKFAITAVSTSHFAILDMSTN